HRFRSFLPTRRAPTSTLFPYTTLFRSDAQFICDRLYEPGGAGENGTTLAILGLAVLPDRRRQGIAAQLMHAYLDRARQGGMERRSEEHTSELQSRFDLVCRLLLEKKKQ